MSLYRAKLTKKKYFYILLFISFVFPNLIVQYRGSNTSFYDEIDDAIAGADVRAFFDNSSEALLDGKISVDEYAFSNSFTDSIGDSVEIFVEHNKTHLFFGIITPTTGWAAIGFNDPDVTQGMRNADFKLASVINQVPYAVDAHACNPSCGLSGFGQPLNDSIDNIDAFNGTEDTKMTFEFVFPFNSTDIEDYSFGINSTLTTFVAYANDGDDEFSNQHLAYTSKLELYIIPEQAQTVTKVVTIIELSLSNRELIEGNENFEIIANVTKNDTGLPIEGLLISFYRITSFGKLELGSNLTNTVGIARLQTNFTLYITENVTLLGESSFKIEGSDQYLEAKAFLTVKYISTHLEEENNPDFGNIYDPFQLNYLVPALTLAGAFLSLVIIWASFLYVIKSLFSIIFEKNDLDGS
ncbi:MAG: hypothetical protein HeimC3_07240 [Candidatus Heimdallarchaeota archaeon LC_3]|nr:MAG: hypothetical protein HeimC3_07240 [Candidatus Heimdallarchaeota archaeon LC_3]